MPRQFKTARKMCKLKLLEAAEKLGVSQPTLSSWEAGRKSPTIDSVLKMAELYKVSTDSRLRSKLRGWYSIKSDWVENSAGCRFSYDTYAVQWLAFPEI